jgi:PAS domain S-box-containing protein
MDDYSNRTREELLHEFAEVRGKYNFLKQLIQSKSDSSFDGLAETYDEFDNFFFGAIDLFCIANTDGIFLKLNEEWEVTLGYSLSELTGMRFLDLVHPDDLEATLKALSSLSEQKPVINFSNRYRKKDGSYRIIEWRSKPSGKLVYAAARDITERVNLENSLTRIRQNYETFFNSIDDFLFVLDLNGNVLHANSTVFDRLEYSPKEVYGKSVLMLHPEDRRDEAAGIVLAMLKGTIEFCPVPIITKSGKKIPVETRISRGFWDGKPVLFGVTKDISKVELSEEKFSKVFYLNPSACGLSDLKTNQYIEVNDAFCTLLGFSKEEAIGKSARDLNILSEDSVALLNSKMNELGFLNNAETDLRAKDGEIKHVIISAENIVVQDKEYRYTVVHDITEMKQIEKEMNLKNIELLKSNAEKDKFFSIIAHDIRSPFNGFLGLTQIMAEELPDLTMDELQKIANSMRNSAANLFRLLDNLLHWASMKQGAIPFEPEAVKLLPLVEESILMMIEPSKSKKISINNSISGELQVLADVNMLQTVFRNLVSNAIKFTPRGGFVYIGAQRTEGNFIEIVIEDTGIGMDSKLMDNIFRLDVQVNRKGTEGEPSTGLGLLLCKELIEKHEGKIRVESETGKGSKFIFRIPAF